MNGSGLHIRFAEHGCIRIGTPIFYIEDKYIIIIFRLPPLYTYVASGACNAATVSEQRVMKLLRQGLDMSCHSRHLPHTIGFLDRMYVEAKLPSGLMRRGEPSVRSHLNVLEAIIHLLSLTTPFFFAVAIGGLQRVISILNRRLARIPDIDIAGLTMARMDCRPV